MTSRMHTTLHVASALQERGFFVITLAIGLFISLIAYAVLVNVALGKEFRLKELSVNVIKLESERAGHQAELASTLPHENAPLDAVILSAVGADFSYLHPNEIFAATELRP